MNLNDYQTEALRTAATTDATRAPQLAVFALGLTGEAGEFADLVKKYLGHGHDLDATKAAKELGDVLWYVATCANSLGFTLEEIAARNVAKLRARYPDGFSSERSKARTEDAPECPGCSRRWPDCVCPADVRPRDGSEVADG